MDKRKQEKEKVMPTEDELDQAWAEKVFKRHQRFIGLRRYTIWDTETNQWSKAIHFQFLKYVDKELFRWNVKKPDWWETD